MSKKYDYNKSDIANIVLEFKSLLEEHECLDDEEICPSEYLG